MGISTTSDQSKIYSNSPCPLVWMDYGMVLQIVFINLKMDMDVIVIVLWIWYDDGYGGC